MSDIKSTILSFTNNFAKTGGNLVKTTKLSIELANEEENLKSIYIDIGKKVHEIYMFGGSLGKFFDDKYKEIVLAEAKIEEMKDKIGVIKGVKVCDKCGRNVDKAAEFCPHCGSRMFGAEAISPKPVNAEPVTTAQETDNTLGIQADPPVKAAEYSICPSCGNKNEKSAKFCLGCGRVL